MHTESTAPEISTAAELQLTYLKSSRAVPRVSLMAAIYERGNVGRALGRHFELSQLAPLGHLMCHLYQD